MDTLGTLLKAERESQKKSLEDVSKKLKIKSEYLEAIEGDNYSLLPPEVYAKAYLRAYAESLGLESDGILSLYRQGMEGSGDVPADPTGQEIDAAPLKKIGVSVFSWKSLLLIAVSTLLFLLVFLNQGPDKRDAPVTVPATADVKEIAKETPKGTAVGTFKETALETFNKTAQKTPEETPLATVKETAMDTNPGELNLTVQARDLTWVAVSIDGGKPKEWQLREGASISFTAADKFALKIGNAGGTRIVLNDRDIGDLGPQGKVVDIVLTQKMVEGQGKHE